jgi:hypothetical protein
MTETNITPINSTPPILIKPPISKKKKILSITLTVLSILFIVISVIGATLFFTVYVPGQKLYAQALTLQTDIDQLKAAVNDKDLVATKSQLTNLRAKLKDLRSSSQKFSYLQALPYAKDYYLDSQRVFTIGEHGLDTAEIVITAIEPYQDFLGLKGSGVDSSKTTEDRIAFLTQSIEGLLPHLDTIEKKIVEIDNIIEEIDINRYPETYKNINVHSIFNQGKETLSEVKNLISNGKPIISKTSWLLGKDKPRNYLVIFQNDGELRPSGGFWTAYATLKVDNGKVIPGPASNIYDLDDKLLSSIPAPRQIKAYHINVPYLNLRDSNLSPDFPTGAKIFLETYYKVISKKEQFDAVVALDTQVLVDLVAVLGKLDTRVGTFTTEPDKRCDGCPKIIYDLEWISGRPRDYIEKDRKGFLGPVMSALLANAMGSAKDKIPLLGEAFFKNIHQKHIMFYFPDEEIQASAQLVNIAGNITPTDSKTDYFHLNDANFASAKSNIFITQKIKHEITTNQGRVEHKVSVTYTNPSPGSNCNLEKGDLCLNAPKYRDMFRFYVSPGSQLIKMTGSEVEPVLYEELGKQVFEGFYGNKYPLYAQSSSKTSIQYTSSVAASKDYTLLLQKQPGTKAVEYELLVNDKEFEKFSWVADKVVKISL